MRLRFSSDAVPQIARKDAINAALGHHVCGSVDFPGDGPAHVALELRAIGGVHLASIDTAPIRLETPSAEDGVVYLSITASGGGGVIDARGSEYAVRAGDLNVMRRDRRCTTLVAEPSRILSIAIPRAQLLPRLASEDCLAQPALRSPAAGRLLEYYAATLLADGSELAAQDEAMLSGHVVDLAVMALGARSADAERAGRGGVRAARLGAIKADIAANFGTPELSLGWVARRHGVSDAYVRALFYEEGTSFTDYVLRERLTQVRALLASPYLAHHTVASLALMAGFSDISWFNQAFRRRFGVTPSDVRSGHGGPSIPI